MEARSEGCSGNGGPRSTGVPPGGWGAAGAPKNVGGDREHGGVP